MSQEYNEDKEQGTLSSGRGSSNSRNHSDDGHDDNPGSSSSCKNDSDKYEPPRPAPVKEDDLDDHNTEDDKFIWVEVESNSTDGSDAKGWKCDMAHISNLIRPEILKAIKESKAQEETYRLKILQEKVEVMKANRRIEERKLDLLDLQFKMSEEILQLETQKLALETKKSSRKRFWSKRK